MGEDLERAKANARLIAAAPKMLQALRRALVALQSCAPADYSTGHVIYPSFDEAACADAELVVDEAIAEAEGVQS